MAETEQTWEIDAARTYDDGINVWAYRGEDSLESRQEVQDYLNALEAEVKSLKAKAGLATKYAEAISSLDKGDRTRGQSRFLYEYDALTEAEGEKP